MTKKTKERLIRIGLGALAGAGAACLLAYGGAVAETGRPPTGFGLLLLKRYAWAGALLGGAAGLVWEKTTHAIVAGALAGGTGIGLSRVGRSDVREVTRA